MEQKAINLNNNLVLHYLKDEKYKTNFISVFLTVPLTKETVTMNALIPAVLKRGTSRLNDMQKIEIELEEMYGSTMDCGLDKSGKNHILKFYIESVKNSYINDNLFEKSIRSISELILDPYIENGMFSNEYVNQEKNTLNTIINDKINDKATYASYRCIEEMFEKKEYGNYVYGYSSDLKDITNEQLFNQYVNILKTARIDIFVYTNETKEYVMDCINKYFVCEYFNDRKEIYLPQNCNPKINDEVKIIFESLDVNQGKLVLGLNVSENLDVYDIITCNAILGVGANSKMFRNVREREHLAYSAKSSYIRNANTILISAGIELCNYDKAVSVIKKQLQDLKDGEISQKELDDAKRTIISGYKTLSDEQYKIINYYINQTLSNSNISIQEAIEKIQNVQMSSVINVANNIVINTIYYLKNN